MMQRTCREHLWAWIEPQLGELDRLVDELSPKERARFIIRLLPFFLPRQVHAEVELPGQPLATIDYSKLSEPALKELLSATDFVSDDAKH